MSYPYEWTFGMLKDAALLHLELMRDALAEGFILKDASPYNVQWRGARPVFIDVPSFEPLGHGEPWVHFQVLGIELDPIFCDVTIRRLKAVCGLAARLGPDGPDFDAVADARALQAPADGAASQTRGAAA